MEARTNESVTGFSALFKILKERGYGHIPYIFKENQEIDTLANKHTYKKDEITVAAEHVENGNPTHFYKEDIHRNAKKKKRHIFGILNVKM